MAVQDKKIEHLLALLKAGVLTQSEFDEKVQRINEQSRLSEEETTVRWPISDRAGESQNLGEDGQIQQLYALYVAGILTQEEFEAKQALVGASPEPHKARQPAPPLSKGGTKRFPFPIRPSAAFLVVLGVIFVFIISFARFQSDFFEDDNARAAAAFQQHAQVLRTSELKQKQLAVEQKQLEVERKQLEVEEKRLAALPRFKAHKMTVNGDCAKLFDYCVRAICKVENVGGTAGMVKIKFLMTKDGRQTMLFASALIPAHRIKSVQVDFREARMGGGERYQCEVVD